MSLALGHRLSHLTHSGPRPSEAGRSPHILLAFLAALLLQAPHYSGPSLTYATRADPSSVEVAHSSPRVGLAGASSVDTSAIAGATAPSGQRSIDHARSVVMILLRWGFVASVALVALAVAGTFGLVPTWRGRGGSPVD